MTLDVLHNALADTRKRYSDYKVRAAQKAATLRPEHVIQSAGMEGLFSLTASANSHAATQYEHYSGWPYAAIQIPAKRIADRAIYIARETARPVKNFAFKHILPKSLHVFGDHLEVIQRHPLLDVLNKPNPIMIQWDLLYISVVSLELTGAFYWWIYKNGNTFQIWPIPSHWVTPCHESNGLYAAWTITSPNSGEQHMVPGEEIVNFYYPSPQDPLSYFSPLQAAAPAVVADEAMQEAQRRSFANGAYPGLALSVGRLPDQPGAQAMRPHLTPEQRRRIEDAFLTVYRGVVNQGKPIILDALIDNVFQISKGPQEMAYRESGAVTKERITQTFAVNPISMGHIENVNRASASVADYNLCVIKINPILEMMSQRLTRWVAPKFAKRNERLHVIMERAIPFDLEEDYTGLTVNEIRLRKGQPILDNDMGQQVILAPGYQLAVATLKDGGTATISNNDSSGQE